MQTVSATGFPSEKWIMPADRMEILFLQLFFPHFRNSKVELYGSDQQRWNTRG
jgi:hypothetical protein